MRLPCGCRVSTRPETRVVLCRHQVWRISELPQAGLQIGDAIAWCLRYVGSKQFKRAYRWLFNRDCGCEKRQTWLNELSSRWLKR